MASTVHQDGSVMGHVWERAQLGVGPYRFLYMESKSLDLGDGTTQPAGTCHYCGTGIRYCYYIKSADGKTFYVGSDCVSHLGDTRLVAVVMSEERKRKNAIAAEKRRQKREAEEAKQRQEIDARMGEYKAAKESLRSLPHPNDYFAGQGLTMADYFNYFESNGIPSYFKMLEAIRKAGEIGGAQ